MIDIAAATVAVLVPYLAKVVDGTTEALGEKVVDRATELLQTIRDKFSTDQDTYAKQTLKLLEDQPKDEAWQAALRAILVKKVQADPVFGDELTRQVEQQTQGQALNQFLTNIYGGEVGQIVNIRTAGDLMFH